MKEFDYLIVGAGLAAASAVDGIRSRDADGTILLLGEEEEPPYHRPPLSKQYIQIPDTPRALLHVKPEGWIVDEGRAQVELGQRVLSLDSRQRTVITARGNDYRAEKLLLATGGRPRELTVPGADLAGIHTLRRVEDAETIRTAAIAADRVALIGAGFIGMELAASLRRFDLRPVVVERLDRVWANLLPSELSVPVQDYFEQRGVEFRLGTGVRAFTGRGELDGIELTDGSKLECQLAIIGVGIAPNQELAQAAGLAVDDGIVVDAFGETSHAHIYATGDAARFPDPLFGDSCRIEHWDHARTHGRLVGANMAGGRAAYDHLSYFFSDVFELSLNAIGRTAGAEVVIARGSLGSDPMSIFCSAAGRLCGIILINAAGELDAARELLRTRPALADIATALADPRVELGDVLG